MLLQQGQEDLEEALGPHPLLSLGGEGEGGDELDGLEGGFGLRVVEGEEEEGEEGGEAELHVADLGGRVRGEKKRGERKEEREDG
jgi:hypothetical protein